MGDFVERVFIPMMKGAPSTLDRDRGSLRTHVLPAFAQHRLVDIDYEMCQSWVNRMEQAGKSPETVHKAVQILGRIIKAAIRGKRLVASPLVDIEMTPIGDHEAMFLEPGQVDTLADAMSTTTPDTAPWSTSGATAVPASANSSPCGGRTSTWA